MKPLKVVKIGGKLIEDTAKFDEFLEDFKNLEGHKILVHGGGNMATQISEKLGYETKMVDGRRITDEDTVKVITMVYGGLINKNIVAKLQSMDTNAIGLCGADGQSILSVKRPVKKIDYGFVGDIEKVNGDFIGALLNDGVVPVFSAISCTKEGVLLNTNADSIASEIARAMSKSYETELYYCFEKQGVLADASDDESVIKEIDFLQYKTLVEKQVITDGMLPKLQNCFEALEQGVHKIHLGNHQSLKENTTHTKIIQ